MSDVHLNQIDLSLLRVFDALAEERSVTRAGQRLGLSQSAVSHALRRLRQLFDDRLFVRGPDGMQPTQRAGEMATALREALVQLQLAIAPSSFSPINTDRRFTIAAGAYLTAVLLPALVERMRAEAPRAEIRVRPIDSSVEEGLRSGAVDVVIGAFSEVPDRFAREPLLDEGGVWVMRRDHPAAGRPLTLETLADIPHIVIAFNPSIDDAGATGWGRVRLAYGLTGGSEIDDSLDRIGRRRVIGLRIHDVYGALSVASRTDMVVLAPKRLAVMHADQLGLKLFDPPYPSKIHTSEMVWSRDAAHPAVDWLRTLMRDVAGGS